MRSEFIEPTFLLHMYVGHNILLLFYFIFMENILYKFNL
jgi:hypothetical protein